MSEKRMVVASRDFQIFAKPVGPACNLECRYCYYLGTEALYPREQSLRMDEALLERYIRQHIESSGNEARLCWHGGEPTLLGLDFFHKVVALQRRFAGKKKQIHNNLQTNGTLLDEAWADFLAGEEFTVGLSLDGPPAMHDPLRITRAGRPSHADALRGFRLLRARRVPVDILCVVQRDNVDHPLEVYRFFKTIGAGYIGFIPLVEQIPGRPGQVTERSVSAEAFGRFMIAIFDEWKQQDAGRVMVQMFEEVARTALGQDHGLCIFRPTCGDVPVVEHNGDVFSCDHFVDHGHRLGNLANVPLLELVRGEKQRDFGEAKRDTLPDYCRRCEVLALCNGGCPKDRIISTPDGEPGLNYLCRGYRAFFNHCRPFMAELERRGGQIRDSERKTGRNEPCPCGSGLKYKRCCLNRQD